jgi:short-subunit dehydrogenase
LQHPRTILITGASSGIGEALALVYAAQGVVLTLAGRNAERLGAVAQACTARGARVVTCTADVTHGAGLKAWIETVDEQTPLDLVIANAGTSAGTGGGAETAAQARQILSVNVDGVLNTVFPVLPRMIARGRGQIALMSSLAAFRGLPGAPSYCASKAFVRVWGEALRPDLVRQGVQLSVICPGFVVSRMTAGNRFPMPFLMSAERAAAIIQRGLARGKARIAFPRRLYLATRLVAALPPGLIDGLLARLPRKT